MTRTYAKRRRRLAESFMAHITGRPTQAVDRTVKSSQSRSVVEGMARVARAVYLNITSIPSVKLGVLVSAWVCGSLFGGT